MNKTMLLLITATTLALAQTPTPPWVFYTSIHCNPDASCSLTDTILDVPAVGDINEAGAAICQNYNPNSGPAHIGAPAVSPSVQATGCSYPIQLYADVVKAPNPTAYFVRTVGQIYADTLQGSSGATMIGSIVPFWYGFQYSDCYDSKIRSNYPPPFPCGGLP